MSRGKSLSKAQTRSEKRGKHNLRASPRLSQSLSRRTVTIALSLALAAATVALYSPTLNHSFLVLDDREYVVANAHVHQGLAWSTVKWALRATEASNWHPLTWLSHALDYQLFALNPVGHHLDNVLLHALNAVLLFLLLAWTTKRSGPALIVAALFAVHPINVESVAWIAERKNVLSTVFLLLTIGAYAWYVRKPDWRRYLLVAALFAAGLMAKPMLVTLPFVLLLLDYWPFQRMQFGAGSKEAGEDAFPGERAARASGVPQMLLKLVLEKIPLLLFSAYSSWMTMKAQRTVVRTFEEFTFGARVANALVAYALYLWKAFWPDKLAFYPHSLLPLPARQWILSGLVLTGISAFVLRFHKERYLAVGWFWFLGTLLPVIGLVQVGEAAMADRYAYVPLIGIFIMIAWGLGDLADAKRIGLAWRVISALCVLGALSWVTRSQIAYWESDYDLWAHTLAIEETPFAHNALGATLMEPDAAMSAHDLENFLSPQTRIDEARRHFERALEQRMSLGNPEAARWDLARSLNNLGNLDRMQNRLDGARTHDEAALKIYRDLAQQNPDAYLPYLAAILNNLGSMDRKQNRLEEARAHFEEALKIDRQLDEENPAKNLPNTAMMLNEFGMLDGGQKRMEEAHQHFEEALKIERQLAEQSPSVYLPQLAMTLENFGMLDAVTNRMEPASEHFEEGLKLYRQLADQNPSVYMPDLAMALSNLARADQIENRIDESRAHYEEALVLLGKLAERDRRYAGEAARIEASLRTLDGAPRSQR